MRKSWLLCVLLGTLAWSQAQPGTAAPPGPAQAPGNRGKEAAPAAAKLPEDAAVLTIVGVCPPAPKKAASAGTSAGKSAAEPAKKTADCKTVITRRDFEKIAGAVSPNVTPQLKQQLATALPKFIALSDAAKAKGLDKSANFQEMLKLVRMQLLTRELERTVQEEADKVPERAIETYYKKNPGAYEEVSLDRLFIPRYKQAEPDSDSEKEQKLTEEQRKANDAADEKKREEGETEMTKVSDRLRARAAAGEDFVKLQKEAYQEDGMKIEAPTVNLPKVRRAGLPPSHAAVFDLKVGEVSTVISDNGGHYVYKVVSKEVLPLEQVKEEIHNKLKSDYIKEAMEKYQNSFHVETNEAYFGPPGPAGPAGGRMGAARMPPVPHNAAPPPKEGVPAQSPAAQPAPPSKPN